MDETRLQEAIEAAAAAHHSYERDILQGRRDEQWAGWYAAYVCGRLNMNDPVTVTRLFELAADRFQGPDWAVSYTRYMHGRLGE